MRQKSLIPLTHDHHHALAAARDLRLATEGGAPERVKAAEEFLAFFDADTLAHFREEEEEVFPLIADISPATEVLKRVMFEHLAIHALVRSLRSSVTSGEASGTVMAKLAASLEGHIRFEEKVVFPLIEELLSPEQMDSISLAPRDRALGIRP